MPFSPTDYQPYDFANRRHIGPSPSEMADMFTALGVSDLEALMAQTVPQGIRQAEPLDFGAPLSEREMLWRLQEVADKNKVLTSLIGQGYHGTITPPAIQRNIFENPAWYTAYTPYQPEISQGRLEALLNYQTMVSDLTGLEIANAFFTASRSGDMGALGAMLAQDVSLHSDGGGKRPATVRPALGFAQVMQVHKALGVLFGKYGSTLLRTCRINGLPGFVTREADGEIQTTALAIEDGRISAIYVMRNPDKLRHLH